MKNFFVSQSVREGSALKELTMQGFKDADQAWLHHNESIQKKRELERSVIFSVKFPAASQNFAFNVLDDYKANWRWDKRQWWKFWKN